MMILGRKKEKELLDDVMNSTTCVCLTSIKTGGITTESKKTDIIIINQLIKRIAYSYW